MMSALRNGEICDTHYPLSINKVRQTKTTIVIAHYQFSYWSNGHLTPTFLKSGFQENRR